jgi:hypothetical protein
MVHLGKEKNAYRILVEKNNRVDLEEINWEDMEWIRLA